ncbi:MAG: YHS domain-containing protein [bacterium]
MNKALIIILVVAVIGTGVFFVTKNNHHNSTTPVTSTTAAASAEKITIGPDEASCPVYGTIMKKSDMIPIQYKGKTYYMCCSDCQTNFNANPEKYIKNPAPLTRVMPH